MDTNPLTDPRLLNAYWERSPIAQAVVSEKGNFLYCNPAWARMLGYGRGELSGQHFSTITHPADLTTDQREVQRLRDDPDAEGYSLEKRYITKRGASLWVELFVFAVRDVEHKIEYFAVLALEVPISPKNEDAPPDPWFRRLGGCVLDLVKNRPREFLAFCMLGLVASGRIPAQLIIDFVKSLFLPK